MFRRVRRFLEAYKKLLFGHSEPKPTVYKIGNKRYIKVKRLTLKTKSKGPYHK